MQHAIHEVVGFEKVAPYTLRVDFEDGSSQVIDFSPVLRGELFAPLATESVFDQVMLDNEVKTLVWPNGADFDPALLHNWPRVLPDLKRLVETWEHSAAA